MDSIDRIYKMQNTIQAYPWGSRTAIAELMGATSPTPQPQAELWMGAHPKAPSKIYLDGRWQPLNQLIAQYPHELLGPKVAKRFDNQLPFLFKVLAAAEPLSIQAHPDRRQAKAGFERENREGVALDAPQRNFRDDQHKPECLCALTVFSGLCGFRSLTEVVNLIGPVWPLQYNHALTMLTNAFNPKGLQNFFQHLMHMDEKKRKDLVRRVVEQAETKREADRSYEWIVRLSHKYPGDIGVLTPLLLNVIDLQPGEAIFLPARQLHAYLEGVGIEVMANSDNVLRGGLTSKHVDIAELIRILDFAPRVPNLLTYRANGNIEQTFDMPAEEFELTSLAPTTGTPYSIRARAQKPEIILCVEGAADIRWRKQADMLAIEKGDSVFVPASVDGYTIEGHAQMYKVSVNL